MNCLEWKEKITLLAEGQLKDQDQEAVLAHLDRCTSCQQQMEASLRDPQIDNAVAVLQQSRSETRKAIMNAAEQGVHKRKGVIAMLGKKGFRIVAAAIVVLIVTGIWYGIGDGPSPYAVYAEMMDALQEVTSVQFVQRNNYGVKCVHYQQGDGTWRREDSTEAGYQATGIYDGKTLAWFNPTKKFVEIQHNPYNPGSEPLPFWKAIHEKINKTGEVRLLGEREIDGKTAIGYEVKLPDQGAFTERVEEIWIDEETRLPLLVESRSVFCYASLSKQGLEKAKARLAVLVQKGVMTQEEADQQIANNMNPVKVVDTYSDFRWNIFLDEKLFDIKVPEGWISQEKSHQYPPKKVRALGYIR
ncbi:MAG: anti-sigma factor family protein [Planctomycetota bacterium]|jgi:outer membrane lipoprotein-sorting protein